MLVWHDFGAHGFFTHEEHLQAGLREAWAQNVQDYRSESWNSTTQMVSTQQFLLTVLVSSCDSFGLDTQILSLL